MKRGNLPCRFIFSGKIYCVPGGGFQDQTILLPLACRCQSAEADSLLESIQNKCNVIKDGKTITSLEENAQETPNSTAKETVLECVSTVEETSANTIRDSRELFSCLNSMRKQVAAYKFREYKLLKVVASRYTSIAKLQEELDVLKSVKTTNSRLQKENRNLITANNAKVTNLENVISTQDTKVQKLHKCIQEQKQLIDSINKKLEESKDTINKLEKVVDKRNATIATLKETINTKNIELSDLRNEVEDYTNQLTECQNTNTELESNVNSLTEQLNVMQSNITITEQESDTNSKRMELEINSYSGLVDELHEKVLSLEGRLNESTTTKNKLSAKIKHLTEQLEMYQHNYVNTKSRQLGVDPAMVQKCITENTTVTQINKLVEDLQKTKDRYAKLPISAQTPKGVSINPDNIKTSTPEEDKLAAFIENVARG